ncbi:uncharacterized protein LOC143251123 isoform X1 [Tachypleus tridentatus]|uniref:uncharacterized protein LOC143251123 isoform X1 n=1 Tax=Tachypleus tridentatus TaxID=6853 RepID=UPI003FD173F6
MKFHCLFLYHKISIIILSTIFFVSSALLQNASPGYSTSKYSVMNRHSVWPTWKKTRDGDFPTKDILMIGHNEIKSMFGRKPENERTKDVSSYMIWTTEAEIQKVSAKRLNYVTRGSHAATTARNKMKFISLSGELNETCGPNKRCSVNYTYCLEGRCRCLSGFTQNKQQCVKEYTEEENKRIKTVMIGVVILLCSLLVCLFAYLCKTPLRKCMLPETQEVSEHIPESIPHTDNHLMHCAIWCQTKPPTYDEAVTNNQFPLRKVLTSDVPPPYEYCTAVTPY